MNADRHERRNMNREQYMTKLSDALACFDKEIRDEIISDYNEHFDMGALNGKTEEQIAEELGSIEELVDELAALARKAGETGEPAKEPESAKGSAGANGSDGEDLTKDVIARKLGEIGADFFRWSSKYAAMAADKAKEYGSKIADKASGEWSDKAKEYGTRFADKAKEYGGEFADKAGEYGGKFVDKAKEYGNEIKKGLGFGDTDDGDSSEADSAENDDNDGIFDSFEREMKKAEQEIEEAFNETEEELKKDESFDRFMSEAKSFAKTAGKGVEKFAGDAFRFAKQMAKGFEQSISNSCESGDNDEEASQEEYSSDYEDDGTVDRVIVKAGCADVEVVRSTDGKINFEYNNNGSANQKMAFRFYHYQKGRTIYAGVERVGTKSRFFSNINGGDIELKVEIPDGLSLVNIDTMSGDIECGDIHTASLKLETMSGDIDAAKASCKEIITHTASGDITMADCKSDSAKASTASGDIDVNGDRITGVRLDTASGDCNFNGSARRLGANSASGDIDISLTGPTEASISTASGDIEIDLCDSEGYTADVTTVSGTITLGNGAESRSDLRNGTYTFGNGETRLDISSVSGDIEVSRD